MTSSCVCVGGGGGGGGVMGVEVEGVFLQALYVYS